MTGEVVDLFAGPGGWDIPARALGMDPVGIEADRDACATRRAAGLRTIHGNVMADYAEPGTLALAMAPVYVPGDLGGLIASPPCPAFSTAGKGGSVGEIAALVELLDSAEPDAAAWAPHDAGLSFDSIMCVEPLRWVDMYSPRWVCFEQVPAVLPIWEAACRFLARRGYSAWCGVLNAADYGVPQTRRRAILIASLDRQVGPPPATHAEHPTGDLEPWVSAWDGLAPFGITPDMEINTGRDWKPGEPRSSAQTIPVTDPAPTLTAKSGGQWQLGFARLNDRGDSPDGYRERDWHDADQPGGDRAGTEAIRLTVPQALALQSMPPDYPVAGSVTSQFRQVGNAIPSGLAWHVLREASGC